MITRKQLIKKYIEFFKSKNHRQIPNSSLIPENDPTVLFTTAGMHPLVPYLLGQKHPSGKRLCNVQRCIRTGDIDSVGDSYHHTFFEMLGNWSLGDYFKKEAIEYSFEFLTKELKIPKEKMVVSCFAGDKDAPKDNESATIWKNLGIKKIKFLPKSDNWWGPAGNTGPCGPDTEMFIDNLEIWNDVFMQYNKTNDGKYLPLKQKNVDTGMGVERTIAILNKLDDNYLTDCWKPIIEKIEEFFPYKSEKLHMYLQVNQDTKKAMRIIADHIKASVFIIADGITPNNTEQGYILRRLIRRAVRYSKMLKITDSISKIAEPVFEIYDDYPELKKNKKLILNELEKEEEKFERTLEKGIRKIQRIRRDLMNKGLDKVPCEEVFLLYQSCGFPFEMIKEEFERNDIKVDEKDFEKEFCRHQELSRTASVGRFKSGLADASEQTTKLHTATHLLISALRKVLKDNSIIQKGSNITAERLRLDFNFPRKLTEKEIKEVENLVNEQIKKSCEIIREEMSLSEAKKKGAVGVFDKKYGDKVSVYRVGDFSKEICAGPHVKNTCELGKFKIVKEESSSSGVRRIKGVLE